LRSNRRKSVIVAAGAARANASFELVAKAARANGKGVRGQPEARGELAAAFDFGPLFVAIVFENQRAIV
jgi:hypothetical protein